MNLVKPFSWSTKGILNVVKADLYHLRVSISRCLNLHLPCPALSRVDGWPRCAVWLYQGLINMDSKEEQSIVAHHMHGFYPTTKSSQDAFYFPLFYLYSILMLYSLLALAARQ